jgi:hypothetical protein
MYLLVLLLCTPLSGVAQFSDFSEWLNIQQGGSEGLYGNGISLHDFNRDGLDDITICTNGNGVRTYINSGDSLEEISLFNFIEGDIKQPVWVDFDNDYDADFFCTVFGGGCYLFRNDGMMQFTDVSADLGLPSSSAKCFGAAWADYDLDGDLDVYVANYDFIMPAALSNWLLRNNGDGTFTETASLLGIDNDFRATFQPAWCDINLDGYPDLFVINDKYHGNALYLNQGGTFTDVSESYNMNHAMEAMSNSWYDYDHDLDFDVYVSNTIQGNKLLRNDGFYFTDVAAETGTAVNSVCWNALWLDTDHDLNTDLHVATNSEAFENNQNKLFEVSEAGVWNENDLSFDQRSVLAEASGDLNNDGYADIVQVSEFPVGTGYLMNNGGNFHYLKYAFQGNVSNADGVGAYIVYELNGESFLSTQFAGAGFIAQDSRYGLLSLKSATEVTNVAVHWPSGWIDHYLLLPADTTYIFHEGETFQVTIAFQNDTLCPGDVTTLYAHGNGMFVWQDGSTADSVMVDAPGIYSVTASNIFGFQAFDTVQIVYQNLPDFEILIGHPVCYDDPVGQVQLVSEDAAGWMVGNIASDDFNLNLSPGWYEAVITGSNGCEMLTEFSVEQPDSVSIIIAYDTACYGMTTQLSASCIGGSEPYEINWIDVDPMNADAGTYSVAAVDANGCVAQTTFEVVQLDELILEQSVDAEELSLLVNASGGVPPYQYEWMNGETSSSIALTKDGIYSCVITDAEGCQAYLDYTYVYAEGGDEKSFRFSCFPVPAADVLYIEAPPGCTIRLIDAKGSVLLSRVATQSIESLDIGSFQNGFYLLGCEQHFLPLLIGN